MGRQLGVIVREIRRICKEILLTEQASGLKAFLAQFVNSLRSQREGVCILTGTHIVC